MRAGQRDKRVVIKAPSRASDGAGGGAVAWRDVVGPLWARIRPIGTRNWMGASQERAAVTTEITIPFRTGIDVGMRVHRLAGQRWTIRSAEPTEDGRDLVLLCESISEGAK